MLEKSWSASHSSSSFRETRAFARVEHQTCTNSLDRNTPRQKEYGMSDFTRTRETKDLRGGGKGKGKGKGASGGGGGGRGGRGSAAELGGGEKFTYESGSRTKKSDGADDSLMVAMKDGFAAGAAEDTVSTMPKKKETGLRYSALAAIAEDPGLASEYASEGKLTSTMVSSVARKSAKNLRSAVKAMVQAQEVSLAFLLDTTGSMSGHMAAVKDQIGSIVKQIQASSCTIKGVAFVGYKDWCDGIDHFETLDFSTDIRKFSSFVGRIRADGGGDYPEDVLGGLNRAVSTLSWPRDGGTKIVFHIGDAPPHGNPKYHNSGSDDYPRGHPSDPDLQSIFTRMKSLQIMYYFGRVNDSCDKMLKVFEPYYGSSIEAFDTSNTGDITASVTAAVSTSVAVTSALVGSSSSAPERKYVMNKVVPIWSRISEESGTQCSFGLPESIKEIQDFSKLETTTKSMKCKIAPNPFDKGANRLAYYGQLLRPNDKVEDVVLKEFITLVPDASLDRMRYMVDMEVQTVASKLAFEFSARLSRTTKAPNIRIKFLMAKIVRIASATDDSVRFMMMEQKYRTEGPMVKYTNNWNFVLADPHKQDQIDLATAFSHFTFQHTEEYCMVCDIQGIDAVNSQGKPMVLLTDPAIHCPSVTRFGKTNLQEKGIEAFFGTHVCNKYCRALGLKAP